MMTETSLGILLNVKITPKSARNQIVGVEQDALKVKIAAVPEKGAANKALQQFIADWLGIARSNVEIVQGHTSRQKRLLIKGIPLTKLKTLVDAQMTFNWKPS